MGRVAGTTFGRVLCDAGIRRAAQPVAGAGQALCELHENRTTCRVALARMLDATCEAAEALAGADIVAFAAPVQLLRANLLEWAPR